MISYVARAISLIASVIQKVILTASITGEIIISTILWICTFLMNILENIAKFFHIIYEDNVFIFAEIPNTTKDMVYSIYRQFFVLQNGLEMIWFNVYKKIYEMLMSTKSFTNGIILVVSEVFILLINTALFMGETMWLIITFIPVHLPQLIKSITKYVLSIILNCIVNSYMKLLAFTNYLTEVPLKSFLGIVIAVIVVRLCVHFKDSIVLRTVNLYWTLVRNIMYIYHLCFNYITNTELQMFTGNDIMAENNNENVDTVDTSNGADVLCVICQERQKCVLTLPCRHICLCTECCRRLYGYQRTCPICRTFIYHSVTVYL